MPDSPHTAPVQDDDAELRIVFDGPPSHEGGRFVECETADGKSISVGTWHERSDGLWELRIASRISLTPDTGLIEALTVFTTNAVMDEYTHRASVDEWVLSKARAAVHQATKGDGQ